MAADTAALIEQAASRHHVPWALAKAVSEVESGGRCGVIAPGPSIGIMQVLPSTARAMGVKGPLTACSNGLEAGMAYLARALASSDDLCAALSAYNRGLSAAPRCTLYGRKVMAVATKIGGGP